MNDAVALIQRLLRWVGGAVVGGLSISLGLFADDTRPVLDARVYPATYTYLSILDYHRAFILPLFDNHNNYIHDGCSKYIQKLPSSNCCTNLQ